MTAAQILAMLEYFPSHPKVDTYLGPIGDRNLRALSNPKIGWYIAHAFVDVGKEMPSCIHFDYIRRAYRLLKYSNRDDTIRQALELLTPINRRRADIIDALLLCRESKFDQIAKLTNLPVETIKAYEMLFFNVKDRLDDPLYMASLAYPETRLSMFDDQPAPAPNQLLRIAYDYGMDDVLFMAGMKSISDLPDEMTSVAGLEKQLIQNAAIVARYGAMNAKSLPAVDRVKALLVAAKGAPAPEQPIEQIGVSSIGATILAEILKVNPALTEESNRLQDQHAQAV
ncbi:MAG: hypothetical protein ACXWC8_13930 [Limisphaerales bacterium]